MQVLILGAGTIGMSVAKMLSTPPHDHHAVTIVDPAPLVATEADNTFDARVLTGSIVDANVLFQAGVMTCDLCVAVTGSEESNLLAATIAKKMNARRVAARVNAAVYSDQSTFDYKHHLAIDHLISVKLMTALELARRIRDPDAMVIENFARGELEMVDMSIMLSSGATGIHLSQVRFGPNARIGTIKRESKTWIPGASDCIKPGDRISMFGTFDSVANVKKMFHIMPAKPPSVMIAGGGDTGVMLAKTLIARKCQVTLLDKDKSRCAVLASKLRDINVMQVDALRRHELETERVSEYDFFVACSGSDETNMLSCVEAEDLGVKHRMAVVGRPDYTKSVLQRLRIDVVHPSDVVCRQVQGMLNTGATIFRNSTALGAGGIEVLEMEVMKDSPVTAAPLKDLRLPPQCIIAAVYGNGNVQMPTATHKFKVGESVVALVHKDSEGAFVKMFETP